jgi:hypothetical protein
VAGWGHPTVTGTGTLTDFYDTYQKVVWNVNSINGLRPKLKTFSLKPIKRMIIGEFSLGQKQMATGCCLCFQLLGMNASDCLIKTYSKYHVGGLISGPNFV